ncbi:hypothetical protein [Rhizobium leguminosarum]|nr:hypothetical protein [Rhizobium leguminosarum]
MAASKATTTAAAITVAWRLAPPSHESASFISRENEAVEQQ